MCADEHVLVPATEAGVVSWKRAFGYSIGAVYTPFLVMALYMVCAVPCTHCKTTSCYLLPVGPGIAPVEMMRQALGTGSLPQPLWFVLTIAYAAVIVGVVALACRGARWLRYSTLLVALAANGVFAFGVQSLIRA